MFRFFIDRPIFASVISFVIMVGGLIALIQLPVAEYPEVAPPTVVITVGLGIAMVFLILAALFERWSLPLAVILSVPFAMLGALIAVIVREFPNDVYFQIGLVVLVGLASKNAVPIVEFAKQKQEQGMSTWDAAIAAARRSMGTGVFGGMIAATFIATAFIPLFYTWLSRDKKNATQPIVETPS